jgi:hypothetical protein
MQPEPGMQMRWERKQLATAANIPVTRSKAQRKPRGAPDRQERLTQAREREQPATPKVGAADNIPANTKVKPRRCLARPDKAAERRAPAEQARGFRGRVGKLAAVRALAAKVVIIINSTCRLKGRRCKAVDKGSKQVGLRQADKVRKGGALRRAARVAAKFITSNKISNTNSPRHVMAREPRAPQAAATTTNNSCNPANSSSRAARRNEGHLLRPRIDISVSNCSAIAPWWDRRQQERVAKLARNSHAQD